MLVVNGISDTRVACFSKAYRDSNWENCFENLNSFSKQVVPIKCTLQMEHYSLAKQDSILKSCTKVIAAKRLSGYLLKCKIQQKKNPKQTQMKLCNSKYVFKNFFIRTWSLANGRGGNLQLQNRIRNHLRGSLQSWPIYRTWTICNRPGPFCSVDKDSWCYWSCSNIFKKLQRFSLHTLWVLKNISAFTKDPNKGIDKIKTIEKK